MKMTNMGITYEHIEKAALALQSQRKSVTGDNIREVLGTGSKGTITKHLRQWRVNSGVKTVDESSVPPHLLQMLRDLWNRIECDADDKITTHKETLERKLSDTQLLLETSKLQNENISAEHNQLKTELANSENINQQLQSEINDAQKKQIASNERITALESHNTEYKNEIARLHQLLKESQAQASRLNGAFDHERKIHADSINSLRKENDEKISVIQADLNQSQIENARLKSDITHFSQSNTKLENELTSLKESHQLIEKNQDALQKENILLKNKLDHEKEIYFALTEKFENKSNENTNLIIQLKTNEHVINQSNNAIGKLEHEMKLLQSKNESLIQEKYRLENKFNQIKTTEEIR